jgi:hypothetical protein
LGTHQVGRGRNKMGHMGEAVVEEGLKGGRGVKEVP